MDKTRGGLEDLSDQSLIASGLIPENYIGRADGYSYIKFPLKGWVYVGMAGNPGSQSGDFTMTIVWSETNARVYSLCRSLISTSPIGVRQESGPFGTDYTIFGQSCYTDDPYSSAEIWIMYHRGSIRHDPTEGGGEGGGGGN